MDHWKKKVAVVAPAGDDVGTAVVKELLRFKITVIGIDYDGDRLNSLTLRIPPARRTKFHGVYCNYQDGHEIDEKMQWINDNLGTVRVLIFIEEIFPVSPLLAICSDVMNMILRVNVTGAVKFAGAMAKSLLSTHRGHIIFINSIPGRSPYSNQHVYKATRSALGSISDSMRYELRDNYNILLTNLNPVTSYRPKDIARSCVAILNEAEKPAGSEAGAGSSGMS